MSKKERTIGQGTLSSYIGGFILSLMLTIEAYVLVTHSSLTNGKLTAVLIGFALAQLWVQLVFFLHVGDEKKPRWNLTVLLFAVMVVGIVVLGSLWIMQNLDYHGHSQEMTPSEIIQDEGFTNHTH
jgi:cytochrome o ubiquinol oxidase operon protein cyoD